MTEDKLYDLLVVGDLNVDLILKGGDLQPEFGQRERLVEEAILDLGGSSAIFACQAAKLGLRTIYVGKVGDDLLGRFLLEVLAEAGVDISAVIVDSSLRTGITVHLSRGEDRSMLTYLGSVAALEVTEVDLSPLDRASHLHLSSFFLQERLQEELHSIFRTAKERGATVSLDTGWDPSEQWNGALKQALSHVDVFLPNEQEALAISGTTDLDTALTELRDKIPLVVVKRGAAGAIARAEDQTVEVEGFPVESVDTVGAGDCFDAGFIYGYLNRLSLGRSLRIGSACGALSTTAIGGTQGQPSLAEVEQFLTSRVLS